MARQRFVNVSLLIGITLIMLSVGFILDVYWQKAVMFTASLVYALLSYRAFTDDD